MATISGVPGQLDTRKGWSTGYPPELIEHLDHLKAARGQVKHPSELAAERAASERQREEERRAAGDPRRALREAHTQLAESRDESARISLLCDKAKALVGELTARQDEAREALRAKNAEAAEALVAAIGSGADRNALPIGPRSDAAAQALEQVGARLQVAKDAHQQLAEEHTQARKALAAAITVVDRAVVAVGVGVAVAETEEIEALAAELQRRRVRLWSLSAALTNEQRRLGWGVQQTPPSVGRAIGSALDGRIDPVWNQRLAQLKLDPEAPL